MNYKYKLTFITHPKNPVFQSNFPKTTQNRLYKNPLTLIAANPKNPLKIAVKIGGINRT